jgi:serine/threonine protein kinase
VSRFAVYHVLPSAGNVKPRAKKRRLVHQQFKSQSVSSSAKMGMSDFEILRKIGKGSFGAVYKVKRKKDGNEYALKKVNIGSLKQREKSRFKVT